MFKHVVSRVLLTVFLVAGSQFASAVSIKIGFNDTAYDEATAALFKIVFERSGYNVNQIKGDPGPLLDMLEQGEIDVYVTAWLPNTHASEFVDFEETLKLITPLYDGAQSYFAVPRYIPKKHLATIDDLTKADIKEKIDSTIITDKRTRATSKQTEDALSAYGLNESGYTVEALESAEWLAAIESKLEEKQWFVIPLTKPHVLDTTKKFRRLKDTKNVFKVKDTAWLVGNKKTSKKIADHIYQILTKMELSTQWIAEIERMAHDENWPYYVAARVWMAEHPYTVEYWISGE